MIITKRIKYSSLFIINKILMKLYKIIISIYGLNTPNVNKPNLYTYCKNYVDICNGENNSDMKTNGEWRFMKRNLGGCKIVFDI